MLYKTPYYGTPVEWIVSDKAVFKSLYDAGVLGGFFARAVDPKTGNIAERREPSIKDYFNARAKEIINPYDDFDRIAADQAEWMPEYAGMGIEAVKDAMRLDVLKLVETIRQGAPIDESVLKREIELAKQGPAALAYAALSTRPDASGYVGISFNIRQVMGCILDGYQSRAVVQAQEGRAISPVLRLCAA